MDIKEILEDENHLEYLSRSVQVQALDGFTITRTSSKSIASPGESVNITITLYNQSGYEVSNIHITDTISEGATFKSGSVTIGGISYSGISIVNGFDVNQIIPSGNSETITYTIIMANPMIDGVFDVKIQSDLTYNVYRITYTQQSYVYTIDFPHGEMEIIKTSDKSVVISGQFITFQNIVKNTGTLEDRDVFFQDKLSNDLTFVEGSVIIDGVKYVDYNPIDGFSLDTIAGKSQKVVTFENFVN